MTKQHQVAVELMDRVNFGMAPHDSERNLEVALRREFGDQADDDDDDDDDKNTDENKLVKTNNNKAVVVGTRTERSRAGGKISKKQSKWL